MVLKRFPDRTIPETIFPTRPFFTSKPYWAPKAN